MSNQLTLKKTSEETVQMNIKTRERLDKLRDKESYDDIMNKIIDCYEKYSAAPFDCDLHCPSCNGFRFFIYRDYLTGDEKKDIAACINWFTDTYVDKLKHKYHKDKRKDFKVRCTRFAHIIFECNECQQEGDGCYKETWYEGTIPGDTMYSDIDPKPEWKCPKHPNSDFSSSTMSECSALISGYPYKCKQHGGYKNDR